MRFDRKSDTQFAAALSEAYRKDGAGARAEVAVDEAWQARHEEDLLRAEIARLRTEVSTLDRTRLMLESSFRDAREEAQRLRAALKPFADLSSIYVRRAETFGWKDTNGMFGAADAEMDCMITIANCRAAMKALEDK